MEGQRVSSSQNKCTLGGVGGVVKTQESWANVLFECPLTGSFFRIKFRLPLKICDSRLDITQKSISYDVVIVTVGRNDYQIHFWILTKDEAVSRMKNADLSETTGQL